MSKRQTLVDSLEGFYLALILDGLHRAGVLAALARSGDITAIARRHGFDRRLLAGLLDYVASRSDVLDRVEKGGRVRFEISRACRESTLSAHFLDQYVGAFGPCFLGLVAILRNPRRGRALVDGARHAAAYADGQGPPAQLRRLIEELKIGVLLDLGCGTGQLLKELALRNAAFEGIGLDENGHAVRLARRSLADAGVDGRVRIHNGSALQVARHISRRRRDEVDAISAVSVANSFFDDPSGRSLEHLLNRLRAAFPDRIVIVCDYYGRLGTPSNGRRQVRRTLIHDVAQLVSGQGVPPRALAEWRRLYERASCRLVEAFERTDDGISWFIHIIQL